MISIYSHPPTSSPLLRKLPQMDSSPRSPPPNASNSAAQLFQVFLRLRPSSPQSSISETRFLTTATGQSYVYVTPPLERNRFKAIEKFAFTKIFDETSGQREVFEETVLPLLEDAVVKGRDGTLATLGVTGSGKVCLSGEGLLLELCLLRK